jgi:hypothetical protein
MDDSYWRRLRAVVETENAMPEKMYGVVPSPCPIVGIGDASTADATFMSPATAIPTVTLSPITASFVEAEYATHFNVHAIGTKCRTLKYNWSLKLQLVDPPNLANSGTPGLGAAVDLACHNHGKRAATTLEFIWQHGEASLANCSQAKMVLSGHQVKITLVANDGVGACTAMYNGTNSGIGKAATCAQVIAAPKVSVVKCQGSPTKLFDNLNGA